MAAGDFNEDGREDLARARYSDGQLRVFLSNGDRTFTETNLVAQNVGNNDPYAVAAGDFDEDGHLDLIAAGGSAGDVSFFQGLGNGAFTNRTGNGLWANLDINTYSSLDAFDYNGDRHLDLVMAAHNGQAYFWAGNGDGTFASNRLTLITGMSAALGVSAPPKPPRVDVAISPTDPVASLNTAFNLAAVGAGVTAGDFCRWTFGDESTNKVAWNFGTNAPNLGPTATHAWTNEGRFLTRLWHTGAAGTNSVRGTWVTVQGTPPVAVPGGPYSYGEAVATQAVWYATLDGAQRMGKYIEEVYPGEEVLCSSSVDFASDYGIAISRDDFDAAVLNGRYEQINSRVVTRSVEVRVLMQIDMPASATDLERRAAALECVRFYPGMSLNAVLHGKTASLIG
jgi:hypothetical protein